MVNIDMMEEKSPKENKKMSISCNSWKKMTSMTSSCSRTKQSKRAEVLGEGPSASASPEVMTVNKLIDRSYLKPEKKHSAAKDATDGVKRASTLLQDPKLHPSIINLQGLLQAFESKSTTKQEHAAE
jgi:hypothetical protein